MRILTRLRTSMANDQSVGPFFFFLTLVLGGMYVVSLTENPTLRQPVSFVVFTLLVNLHIALHWMTPRLEHHMNLVAPYLVLQGLLAFVITSMAGHVGMLMGVYMALIGEAFGMRSFWLVKGLSVTWIAVTGYLALSLVNYGIFYGWNSLFWWGVAVMPTVLFVWIYVTLYSRQSEARERAQALLVELEAANRQLSEYADQVEDLTIASERQRMARELHDTLSQGLAGVILQLEAADAHLSQEGAERAQVIIRQAMERARETLADARRAIGDLRQGQPEYEDLEEALRQEAAHFTRSTGIPCDLSIHLPAGLPTALGETVLRLASESLTNIARHAHASHASLSLQQAGERMVLEVEDNGCGFDPEALQVGHYGLLGMRERSRLANGTMEILSRPENGTQLKFHLPLPEPDA